MEMQPPQEQAAFKRPQSARESGRAFAHKLKEAVKRLSEPSRGAVERKKKGPSIDDVTEQWKEDFSHRPSWCDAGMALEQIRRGKAKGSRMNRAALRVRSLMQRFLFVVGCFIQRYCFEIFFALVLLLGLFCVGLRDVRIQTDIVKLWVEQGGRLDDELSFLSRIRTYTAPDAPPVAIVPKNVTVNDENSRSAARTKRAADTGPVTDSASLGGGFQVVIQTPKSAGLNILNQRDLLLHTAVLSNVTQMTVHMYGEDWSLRDLCFKPPAPSGPGVAGFVSDLLDAVIPCVMITPLDCFWEGAKPLGPFPAFPLPSLVTSFVPSLANAHNMTWKNLNPEAVMIDIKTLLNIDLGMVENTFKRAGVGSAYQERECIDPLDFECPSTAPNFFNPCLVLNDEFFRNQTELNPINLEEENITKCDALLDHHDNHVAGDDFLSSLGFGGLGGAARFKRQVVEGDKNYDEHDSDYYKDYYDEQGNGDVDSESPLDDIFQSNKYSCYTFSEPRCLRLRGSLAKWLRENMDKWDDYIPKKLQPKIPNFGHKVTGGCGGFAREILNWPEDLIIGGVERNESEVVQTAEALQSVTLLAGGGAVYGRFVNGHKSKPNLDLQSWNPSKANRIVNAWQRKFTNMLYNHVNNSQENGADRQLHPLAGTSIGDMMAEFSKFKYTVIVTGYFLMLLYAGISLITLEDHGINSCCGLGFQGVLLVTFASASGLGLSTLCGIEFNAATTQIVPFLTLGLGVDDMFLLVHNYKDIVKIVHSNEVGYLMKETGLSVLLTSINNILAFLAGGMLPVPALRSFCNQTAILLFFNVIAILTIYPACIAFDLKRRKARRTDIFVCLQWPPLPKDKKHKKQKANGYGPDPVFDSIQEEQPSKCSNFLSLHKFVDNVFIPLLQNKIAKAVVCVVGVVLVGFGVAGIAQMRQGLELTDVIPKDTAPYAFLAAREKYFSFYPMFGVIKGPGVDFARMQKTLGEYRDKIASNRFTVANQGKLGDAYWLDMMHKWLVSLQKEWDKLSEDDHLHNYHNITLSDEQHIARRLICNTGPHDCSRIFDKSVRFIDPNTNLINEIGFYEYLTAWYHQDQMMYHVSQASFYPTPPDWSFNKNSMNQTIPRAKPFLYSQIPFFLNNLKDTPLTVEAIVEIREICDDYTDNHNLPNFPQGIPFTFWEQYLHLNGNLIKAVVVITFMVFVVISLLLMSPWTAALVVAVIVMMNVELAGYMGWVGLKLNPVSAVTLITAIGIGVEFTVHISLAYLTSLGTPNERLARTLDHMFIPVIHGGLSTLLGIIMLAFSEFEFIVRYFFLVMSALILLGLFNGLALLPVLLSLIGPPCEVHTLDGESTLDPPSGPPSITAKPTAPPQHHELAARQQYLAPNGNATVPIYVDASNGAVVSPGALGVVNAGFPATNSYNRLDEAPSYRNSTDGFPSVQVVVHNNNAGGVSTTTVAPHAHQSPASGTNSARASLVSGARNSLLGLTAAGSAYAPLDDLSCPITVEQGARRPISEQKEIVAAAELGLTALNLKLHGVKATVPKYQNLSDDDADLTPEDERKIIPNGAAAAAAASEAL